jgi:hypothetical protein
MERRRIVGQVIPDIARHADDACEGMLAMVHDVEGVSVLAPDAVDALVHLFWMNDAQSKVLEGIGLAVSRAAERFDAYETEGGDSAERIAQTRERLRIAAMHVQEASLQIAVVVDRLTEQRYRKQ